MESPCCCHKTKHRTEDEVRALQNRISRIEGQVRGIRGMIDNDAYCTDVLTQISATTAALNALSREILEVHLRTCVADRLRSGDDGVIDELVDTLRKMSK